jgi:DNA-directed RNA polymerase subunit RPC12/RpoP
MEKWKFLQFINALIAITRKKLGFRLKIKILRKMNIGKEKGIEICPTCGGILVKIIIPRIEPQIVGKIYECLACGQHFFEDEIKQDFEKEDKKNNKNFS